MAGSATTARPHSQWFLTLATCLLFPFALAACVASDRPESLGDSTGFGETSGTSATNDSTEGLPDDAISWDVAGQDVGTTQRVCGPLAGTGSSADDVFLNIGRNYPDPNRFTIVLWDVGGVEVPLSGTTVCASGRITIHNDVAQIELRSMSDVELLD